MLPPKREKGSQDLSVAWPAGGHEVRANGSRKEAKKTEPLESRLRFYSVGRGGEQSDFNLLCW